MSIWQWLLKTPRNMWHTPLLLTFHGSKNITQLYLTSKGSVKGDAALCLKKVRRKCVLNHKTTTGSGLDFWRVWIMASHNYRLWSCHTDLVSEKVEKHMQLPRSCVRGMLGRWLDMHRQQVEHRGGRKEKASNNWMKGGTWSIRSTISRPTTEKCYGVLNFKKKCTIGAIGHR